MDDEATWRELIKYELEQHPGEQIIAVVPDEAALDVKFDSGYGSPQGPVFTAWTQNRVIFPVCYDGAESVASVPRNPSDEETSHVRRLLTDRRVISVKGEAMSDEVRNRLIGILARHAGGWLDNGNPDKCRCYCGHRGALGEFHGTHVADDILFALFVADPT